jgi:hypothetical protein
MVCRHVNRVDSEYSWAVLAVGYGVIVAKRASLSNPTSVMICKLGEDTITWQEIHKPAQSTGINLLLHPRTDHDNRLVQINP